MTSSTPLFAKIRLTLLGQGRSERTARHKARLLESASYADFVRLTPEQNMRLGFSLKARRYVHKDAKRLNRATATISARQHETKKAREVFGLTPEQATQARQRGGISYVSADQRERVAKAAITREETKVVAEIKKLRAAGGEVPINSTKKRRHGSSYRITPDAERRYQNIRRRKLAGEHIPDGEWHWFIDYARRFKDPRYELLRGSPAAFGFSLVA